MLSTTDDRILAEHVKHVHSASNLQRNSNPNPTRAYQHHCERCYDYDPIMCCSAVVMALFTYLIVSNDGYT
jgi:hypothetical protein